MGGCVQASVLYIHVWRQNTETCENHFKYGVGDEGRMTMRMNLTKVHGKHMCKCHSGIPVQLIYAIKKLKCNAGIMEMVK
jgi:hypothetical protein